MACSDTARKCLFQEPLLDVQLDGRNVFARTTWTCQVDSSGRSGGRETDRYADRLYDRWPKQSESRNRTSDHFSTCWLKPTLVELSEPSEKRKAISRSASTTRSLKVTRSSMPSSREDRYTEFFIGLDREAAAFRLVLGDTIRLPTVPS